MSTATLAEFARLQGWDRSYVTRLKQAGRLVMHEDRVDINASRTRIAETGSQHRDDVAQRHAAARTQKASPQATLPGTEASAAATKPRATPSIAAVPPATPEPDQPGNSYQAARAVKEKYLALTAKADYERQIASLVDAEAVEAAMKHIGAAARSAMENFPDQVAPLVVPCQTVDDARAVLEQQCRNFLINFVGLCEQQSAALKKGDG